MSQILSWYQGRSSREQRLILAMLAIALSIFLWLAIWRPVSSALDDARERHEAAVERHARALAAVEGLKGAARPVATPAGDMSAYVGEAAANAGLTLGSATPQGRDRVAVTIPNGDPRVIIGWLRVLEQQGFVVQDLRMTPVAQGTASLSAVLARPRR
ncbi:type II secretion system protein GspM [Sphingomonas arenae]|uniref:type II secretion system protein GspM n=1 Tax=Sphingomonas arenae TaxID=2812555 RepID=UPI001967F955|nr:type II secretion system protein GspM [Sphingomonas arenae]